MKLQAANFLLAIFIFTLSPFKEFLKTPLMVIHYYHHQQKSPEITFLSFLDMHYMHGIALDDDMEQDMQLPFKAIDFNSSNLFFTHQIKEIGLGIQTKQHFYSPKLKPFNHYCLQDAHLLGIFHPPQIS